MAKFYIIARENESYNLITIEDGKYLEDIDIFTSDFENKVEFIDYLRKKGYNLSDDVDLYAVNKGRKEIYHRELLFGNKKLAEIAELSKNTSVDFTYILDKYLEQVKENYDLESLIRKNYFTLYGDLRNITLNSKRFNKMLIPNWMRHNYFVVRDAVAAIMIYKEKKNEIINHNNDDLINEQNKLNKKRKKIDNYLDKKSNYNNEQLSLIGEPNNYINLTYIKHNVVEDDTKKVTRVSKVESINNIELEKLTIPYEFITDKIDYSFINSIIAILTSIPFRRVSLNNKERYEIDFDKVSQILGRKFSDDDIKLLNRLIDSNLRKNIYWARYYHNQDYPSVATYREEYSYRKKIYNKLYNSALKEDDVYDNAYNFYLIYKAMIGNLDVKRGKYGK